MLYIVDIQKIGNDEQVKKEKEKKLFAEIHALYGLDDDVRVAIVKSDDLDGTVVLTDEKKNDKNKYSSFWQAYNNISAHITLSSSKANVNQYDVVGYLTRNGHAPTEMAALLMDGKLGFDDIASYVEDAINELKERTPKIKAGHWIHHPEVSFIGEEHWECSVCHKSTMTNPVRKDNNYDNMYFCPKCGARMEG